MIAIELARIHDTGIIHGDISVNNVLFCMDHTIKFIDFGLAYETNSEFAVVFSPKKGSRISKRIAPERISDDNSLRPHTNQDVYSLGYLFKEYLKQCGSEYNAELTASFKSIGDFIQNAMNIDPEKRPALALFCNQLNDELARYENQPSQASSSIEAGPAIIAL